MIPWERPLKSPPVDLEGVHGAELGHVLELELGGHVIRFPSRKVPMVWIPEKKCLVLIEGAKRGRPRKAATSDKARKAFEAWADREADSERDLEFSSPRGARWYALGPCKRIDYRSDKWGRTDEYTHTHGKGVRLYRYGSKSPKNSVYVLKGGRLRVSERGILN